MPLYDLYRQIVHALTAGDVETVMVGGRPVMQKRRDRTLDETAAVARARDYGVRVERSLRTPSR